MNLDNIGNIGQKEVTDEQIQAKSVKIAYILAAALGFFGAHNFYLDRTWFGLSFLSSFGDLGIGYVVDLLRIPELVQQANDRIANPDLPVQKSLIDAYMMWFPYGVLGLHLYYLGKRRQALLYLCTGGLFGVGFILDIFRMPALVKEANEEAAKKKCSCCDCSCCCLP